MEGFCGGKGHQWSAAIGGRCGICGDAWDAPVKVSCDWLSCPVLSSDWSQEHEAPGGKFANGVIVRQYAPGDTVTVTSHITANHVVRGDMSREIWAPRTRTITIYIRFIYLFLVLTFPRIFPYNLRSLHEQHDLSAIYLQSKVYI